MDAVTKHLTNHEIPLSSPITASWTERGGDRLMGEMMLNNEMKAYESRKQHFAPALPMMKIAPGFADVGFQEHDIRVVVHNTLITQLGCQLHEICLFVWYSREMLQRPASTRELLIMFLLNERTVRKTLLRVPENCTPLGRHTALCGDSESSVIASLLKSFRRGTSMSPKELLQAVWRDYRASLMKWSVHAFIRRHLDEPQVYHSFPQENP
jgi:hypothetical protein